MAEQNQVKWYLSIWFVVVMLFLFFPVGLFFMWKSPKFNKFVKIAVSVFFVLVVLGSALGDHTSTTSSPQKSISNSSNSSNNNSNHPSNSVNQSPQPPAPEKPDLELMDVKSENDDYSRYVVGIVKNNTDRNYGYVQVEINLYDNSGAQVGSTMSNTNNLEPNSTWKFKAPILEETATRFKVKKVTGY